MPSGRTNRVAPDSSLHAVPERGGMFGNRGPLLAADGRVARPWSGRRWIVCELSFRGRRREQWRPGQYTELYFLDEATAFAAGHRPCAECRRPAYEAFRQAVARATGATAPPSAPELDAALHHDRWTGTGRRTWEVAPAALPDGVVVHDDAAWWLVADGALRRWSFAGYGERRAAGTTPVTVVTPRLTVEALRAGYSVGVDAGAC